jgi:carbonic anhydrase
MNGVSNGRPAEYIGPWVRIAKRARERVVKELSDKEPPMQIRACEQAAILVSLENLLSFTWITERVESGTLLLHGWYFDIGIGQLHSYSPDMGYFEPLG